MIAELRYRLINYLFIILALDYSLLTNLIDIIGVNFIVAIVRSEEFICEQQDFVMNILESSFVYCSVSGKYVYT